MPLTLVTTLGSATANAYCTKSEADTYHEGHPYATTWTAATDDNKNRAIATATALLDRYIAWNGWVLDDIQALQWPRSGCIYRTGYSVPTTIVPGDVKNATAEFARQLLAADRTADDDVETKGITSLGVGPISLAFDQSRTHAKKVIPDAVAVMIDYLGRIKSNAQTNIPLARM